MQDARDTRTREGQLGREWEKAGVGVWMEGEQTRERKTTLKYVEGEQEKWLRVPAWYEHAQSLDGTHW